LPAVHQINIRDVIADFDRNNELVTLDSIHCLGVQDVFNNTSQNATSYLWSFGDGSTGSAAFSPTHTYAQPGTYTVQLAISDTQFGCKDTMRKKMVIIPPPAATITLPNACAGSASQFTSVGTYTYYTYTWMPSTNLSCTVCPNPIATLTTSTTFTIDVTDTLGCTMKVVKSVYIQEPPKSIIWDTSIVIGQQVAVPGYVGAGFSYTWSPTTALSCTACATPVSSTTVDILYTSMVADSMGCFTATNTFSIHVEPLSSVDVPTAFTPNGDGVNDVIYVDGWGIKKLNYFRVYNRWGQLLFESNDINIGWDGNYNGVPQNMETYVYQVSVETYIDAEPLTKSSTFKLIR
jgi:gliding motility-associated-like protein